MIRTKGEAGTGNIVEAVRHMRLMNEAIAQLQRMTDEEIYGVAKFYANRYAELAKIVREGMGLPTTVLENEPIYEGFTLAEIVDGL